MEIVILQVFAAQACNRLGKESRKTGTKLQCVSRNIKLLDVEKLDSCTAQGGTAVWSGHTGLVLLLQGLDLLESRKPKARSCPTAFFRETNSSVGRLTAEPCERTDPV